MNAQRKKTRAGLSHGLTLLEVMIGMFLFALVSLGITAMVVQSQKIAQSNLIRNTSHNIVQGYLEQIKSIAMSDLKTSIAAPGTVPIATVTVSPTVTGTDPKVDDPLYIGVENAKTVVFDLKDVNGTSTPVTIQLWVTPTVNDLSDPLIMGINALPAIEVILNFQYEARHLRGISRGSGSLRIVKSEISE